MGGEQGIGRITFSVTLTIPREDISWEKVAEREKG